MYIKVYVADDTTRITRCCKLLQFPRAHRFEKRKGGENLSARDKKKQRAKHVIKGGVIPTL